MDLHLMAPSDPTSHAEPAARSIRWWPAVALALLGLGAFVWVRFRYEANHQEGFLRSAGVVLITMILLAIWFMFFSRIRWRVRWIGLAIGLVIATLAPALLEIRGVTGNLVPILQWRW